MPSNENRRSRKHVLEGEGSCQPPLWTPLKHSCSLEKRYYIHKPVLYQYYTHIANKWTEYNYYGLIEMCAHVVLTMAMSEKIQVLSWILTIVAIGNTSHSFDSLLQPGHDAGIMTTTFTDAVELWYTRVATIPSLKYENTKQMCEPVIIKPCKSLNLWKSPIYKAARSVSLSLPTTNLFRGNTLATRRGGLREWLVHYPGPGGVVKLWVTSVVHYHISIPWYQSVPKQLYWQVYTIVVCHFYTRKPHETEHAVGIQIQCN